MSQSGVRVVLVDMCEVVVLDWISAGSRLCEIRPQELVGSRVDGHVEQVLLVIPTYTSASGIGDTKRSSVVCLS